MKGILKSINQVWICKYLTGALVNLSGIHIIYLNKKQAAALLNVVNNFSASSF